MGEALSKINQPSVMDRLSRVSARSGLSSLADTLGLLGAFVSTELAGIEDELQSIPHREELVGQSAKHLLRIGGKRIRPLCVAIASRFGDADSQHVRKLASAVELVHSATLLHDDVVDHGDLRRGQPTARSIYGNAASVFAGDWLLIEALRRVRSVGRNELLDSLIDIIDEMVQAEAIQLDYRGRIQSDEATYFQVVEGKTAALFRWALQAGGRAAGLSDANCRSLEQYGLHLGIAFQIVDDALDVDGSEGETGKALFADLREGKMTYPFLVGLKRHPRLGGLLQSAVEAEGVQTHAQEILRILKDVEAIEATHDKAVEHASMAVDCLAELPDCMARRALEAVAHVAAQRRS